SGGYSAGSPTAASWTAGGGIWPRPSDVSGTPGQDVMVGSNEIASGAHNYAATINVYYDRGISDFCGGCHQNYLLNQGNFFDSSYGYIATIGGASQPRYRHAVSAKGYYASASGSLTSWTAKALDVKKPLTGGRALRRTTDVVGGTYTTPSAVSSGNYNGDQVTCLTCHYAHGSAAQATGWASNVAPTNDSANLYLDNRGVCQACHAKGASQ
ncbi:MAG: hypothetical protein M1358_14200, partial [Chloroflexi bacterium]|nr:hypothetical protein [Chloroflexota bacterium]